MKVSQEQHNLEPGAPLARAQGCICSPERNHDGYGVATEKGRTFFPSKSCPLHGLAAVGKTWRDQVEKPA
jgi:hypothetical protein